MPSKALLGLGRGNGEAERGRKGMAELGDGFDQRIEGRDPRAKPA